MFKAPSHLRHKIDAFGDKGFANITAAYCVPISPGKSRVLVKQPFRFKSRFPALAFSASSVVHLTIMLRAHRPQQQPVAFAS